MSAADTWIDEKSAKGGEREPLEVVLSRVILGCGVSVSLGIVAMAVIWSSTPAGPAHQGAWRPGHQFHAARVAALSSAAKTNHARRAAADPDA